ncbi:protein ALTERED XYLOGLUCAN 4-like isoform X3 [Dioscorea cayenensis subsp. rotundata]|uniref:Protein ALTERED XYLOGLUCAN 4-like isoform X3 n=1 Tax=Dioscorea cayennensis subsp. rotundata TaxID=55577 RepID=A0AB40BS15_DIOCR|nr:protein ALTERED XYLOGLUCAN 4-like isoform X3 [Dioscorea cayenensis subsp. rotundata]
MLIKKSTICSFILPSLILCTVIVLHNLNKSNSFTSITPKQSLIKHNQSAIYQVTKDNSQHVSKLGSNEEKACDLFVGKWIRDFRESNYNNWTCPTLPTLKNCLKHGKDSDYIYWRWKPDNCEFPRFDSSMFLRTVQRRKLAFIGDSLARNQMESLLCLLSQLETPVNKQRDADDKFQTWYFPSHDFTLMVMWTEFLVVGNERIVNGTASNAFDIHLDKVNGNWSDKLEGIHYAIISSGNWFFRTNYLYKGGNLIGCIYCRDSNLTDYGPVYAIKNALSTSLEFISKSKECEEMVTVLRTYTPSHFEHGSWFNGGYCNRTQPLSESEVMSLNGHAWRIRESQVEEFGKIVQSVEKKKKFVLLDVSKAMMLRADGHPGSHWPRIRDISDCLHWCLPGPVDLWNELLMVILNK